MNHGCGGEFNAAEEMMENSLSHTLQGPVRGMYILLLFHSSQRVLDS